MSLPKEFLLSCPSINYNAGNKPRLYHLKPKKFITMKSFLIMVAAVVVGVIVAGYVKSAISKKTAGA